MHSQFIDVEVAKVMVLSLAQHVAVMDRFLFSTHITDVMLRRFVLDAVVTEHWFAGHAEDVDK